MGRQADLRYAIFAETFFVDCNAAAAYLRAGYHPKTPGALWAAASRLLKHDKVQALLRLKLLALQKRLDLQHDRVLLEDTRLAYSDLRQLCTWGPEGVTLKDSTTLPDEAAAAVQEVSCIKRMSVRMVDQEPIGEQEVRIKIKLHQKTPALAHLHDVFRRGLKPLDLEGLLQTVLLLAQPYIPGEQYGNFTRDVQAALSAEVGGVSQGDASAILLAPGHAEAD